MSTAYWFGDSPEDICHYVNLGDLTTQDRFGWDKTSIKYQVMNDWKGQPCRDGHAMMAPVAGTTANLRGSAACSAMPTSGSPTPGTTIMALRPRPRSRGSRPRGLRATCDAQPGQDGDSGHTRAAFRLKMNATDRRFTFGFRVVRD